MSAMSRPAVFLDRDKTIIEDPGFIRDPDQVRLKPDAARAIRCMRDAGYRIVVASNQSGVARGLIREEELDAVHDRLCELLRREGAEIDAVYYCPFLDGPEAVVDAYRRDSDLRKPNPGLLLKAAREMALDLARSWMIGDRPADIEAGRRAGCRTVLIAASDASVADGPSKPDYCTGSLLEAANIVERHTVDSTDPKADPSGVPAQEVAGLLTDIRNLLDRQQRSQRQDDFSFLRLFGALAQMFALVLAVWGLTGMFDPQTVASAIARINLAVFFQLVTLTTLLTEPRR
jgi:D-glycero-D-manno-heptose 1,7-bisphosphate phosphatase